VVVIDTPTDVKHEGVFMTIEGTVDLQISTQNVGAFDAFYNSVKVCTRDHVTSPPLYLPTVVDEFSAGAIDDVLVRDSPSRPLSEWYHRNTV